MKKVIAMCRQFGRNALALIKRIIRAVKHGDEVEVLAAIINLMDEFTWCVCIIGVAFCFIAGFCRPHCFILVPFFYIAAGIVRSNIRDRKSI